VLAITDERFFDDRPIYAWRLGPSATSPSGKRRVERARSGGTRGGVRSRDGHFVGASGRHARRAWAIGAPIGVVVERVLVDVADECSIAPSFFERVGCLD
jgi:hypothetical protein